MLPFRVAFALVSVAAIEALAAEQPRYRIVSGQTSPKLLEAINAAVAQHYRRVFFDGGALLMELSGGADMFKYQLVARDSDRDLRKQLNTAGVRGYRVVDAIDRASFPIGALLLEKALGRPNQFQYVLENAHDLAVGGPAVLKDDFSLGPSRIATRSRDGYAVVAQFGTITVLEKAAEQTAAGAPCRESSCYDLRTLDSHKQFGESLTRAGASGLRLRAVTSWTGWSVHAALVLLARVDGESTFEYRAIPAEPDNAGTVAELALEGFRVRAKGWDRLILERSPRGPRFEYRVVSGLSPAVESELEKVAAEGFHPVMLSAETHGIFQRVVTYAAIAEREEGQR